MVNSNKEAINEELNVQINAIAGFNQGDELMKNAVEDINTLAKAREVLNKIENDNERLKMEKKESDARIKQGWVNTGLALGGVIVSTRLLISLNIGEAIDRHNGNFMDRSQLDVLKILKDSLIKNIRVGKRG